MIKLLSFILHPYYLLRARIAYDRAIRKAEEQLALTGQRNYIIKGLARKLVITDRKSFRQLKHHGYIKKNASVQDLERASLYHTSYRNGTGSLSPESLRAKRTAALHWLSSRS